MGTSQNPARTDFEILPPGAEMCGEGCERDAFIQFDPDADGPIYCWPCLDRLVRVGTIFTDAMAEAAEVPDA